MSRRSSAIDLSAAKQHQNNDRDNKQMRGAIPHTAPTFQGRLSLPVPPRVAGLEIEATKKGFEPQENVGCGPSL